MLSGRRREGKGKGEEGVDRLSLLEPKLTLVEGRVE